MTPWTLDFETKPIDFANPYRAPVPVGLAVRYPHTLRPAYFAWGHPRKNMPNGRQAAQMILAGAWADDRPLLFHNAQFDLAVARQHFGLPWPDASRIEDTRILAFLADSYRERLGLKDLAADLLGQPPDEQTALYAWIRANVPEAKRKKNVGAWIGSAPGDLVAPYAIGDVQRTYDLWKLFTPVRRAMPDAYRLEIETIEVAQALTEEGVPVDVRALEYFAEQATKRAIPTLERQIRRALGIRGELAGEDGRNLVADALERKGWVREWVLTYKERKRSLAADDLAISLAPGGAPAKRFVDTWRAYQLLQWQLRTLARPWLERQRNGRVHVSWDTTRNAERGKLMGARTGRLSSTPNFQNVGKNDPPDGLTNPRTWIRAPRGSRLIGGDLSGQEPRIMAHFAGGRMLEQYVIDPHYDPHGDVAALMRTNRTVGKVIGLATPYGRGIAHTAQQLGANFAETRRLVGLFWQARPELLALRDALKLAWATGRSLVTWAGAEIRVEPTPEEPGRFAYRALQILVQRSAAEQLKRAMVTAHRAGVRQVLSVHDELAACAPREEALEQAKRLQDALEHTGEWRVPFVAGVRVGTTWKGIK